MQSLCRFVGHGDDGHVVQEQIWRLENVCTPRCYSQVGTWEGLDVVISLVLSFYHGVIGYF